MNTLTTEIILNNLSYDKQIELYETIKEKHNFDGIMFVHFTWENLIDYGNAPQILFKCRKPGLGQKIKKYFIDLYKKRLARYSEWYVENFNTLCSDLQKFGSIAKLADMDHAYAIHLELEQLCLYNLEEYFTFDVEKYLNSNNKDKIELIRSFLMDPRAMGRTRRELRLAGHPVGLRLRRLSFNIPHTSCPAGPEFRPRDEAGRRDRLS